MARIVEVPEKVPATVAQQSTCPVCGDGHVEQLFPDSPAKTIIAAVLSGVGLGIGFGLVEALRRAAKKEAASE